MLWGRNVVMWWGKQPPTHSGEGQCQHLPPLPLVAAADHPLLLLVALALPPSSWKFVVCKTCFSVALVFGKCWLYTGCSLPTLVPWQPYLAWILTKAVHLVDVLFPVDDHRFVTLFVLNSSNKGCATFVDGLCCGWPLYGEAVRLGSSQ